MEFEPYVGVTGFMTRDEIEKCLTCVPPYRLTDLRIMMVGVLVSSKTIAGNINTLFNKFPRRESIVGLFSEDSRTFNCLHFASSELDKLYDHLMLCLEYGGDNLDGIQLNIVWPDDQVMRRIKDQRPDLKFIVQVSPHLVGYSAMTPWQIAREFAGRYRDLADYALVDFSRGLGIELHPGQTLEYLDALRSANPDFGLVVGGGLHAGNIKILLEPLKNKYPDLSTDTEGKIRDHVEDGGGTMNIAKAQAVLRSGFEIFSGNKKEEK